MSAEPLPPLSSKRLIIVTGKGGTGKTTVAAALAVASARSGRRVLVAEVGGDEQIPQRIVPDHPPVGYRGAEVLARLRCMQIDPFEALSEYLGLQLHARGLVDRLLRNRGFRQLLEAAPGWRELITLGKVWHLFQQNDPRGRPLYEQIIVDAPATGHGLTFVDVPRVVASAVRAGPLRSNAVLVEEMIADRAGTLLLPVSLAEELPAHETIELVERARTRLGIAIDRIVVNAVQRPPFEPGVPADLDRLLARIPDDAELGSLPRPRVLAACASLVRSRWELNRRFAREIETRCGLPIVELPHCASGIEGADQLAAFAAPLLEGGAADAGDDAGRVALADERGAAH